jgi:hypothetical protein
MPQVSAEAEIHDQVWLVVDADGRDLESLAAKAVDGDIRLGVSRPCFELWLLLHHIEYSTPQWECRPLKQKLKSVLPGWSEGSTRFDDFADGLGEACRRAQQLESTGQDLSRNPSTSVWCLIEAIIAASNAQPRRRRPRG